LPLVISPASSNTHAQDVQADLERRIALLEKDLVTRRELDAVKTNRRPDRRQARPGAFLPQTQIEHRQNCHSAKIANILGPMAVYGSSGNHGTYGNYGNFLVLVAYLLAGCCGLAWAIGKSSE